MTDKPCGKQWGLRKWAWIAVALPVLYIESFPMVYVIAEWSAHAPTRSAIDTVYHPLYVVARRSETFAWLLTVQTVWLERIIVR